MIRARMCWFICSLPTNMQEWIKLFCSEDLFTSGTVGLCICVGEFIGVAGIHVQLDVLLCIPT